MAYVVAAERAGPLTNVGPLRVGGFRCRYCDWKLVVSPGTEVTLLQKEAEGFTPVTICLPCLPGLTEKSKELGYPVNIVKVVEK